MKLRKDDIKINKSENLIESMFGISENDSAHILMILRDKLYSNKILAVVREYTTNALDAHVEAGKADIPIKITLPTALEQIFRVRDYGFGLSEEEVRNLYVMYGASTKRTSDNVIGQLGLGCKSAFAYTDKFHVISWYKGEKKTYCAYIDETKCGKIALLTTEPADEPDGIEVQVPVKREDTSDFFGETINLVSYFKPIPEVIGIADIEEPKYWLEREFDDGTKICMNIIKDRWTDDINKIIMGGIPYKLNEEQLNLDYEGLEESFLRIGTDFYVNIGTVDVTASREGLEYTEHTIFNLKAIIKRAAETFIKSIKEDVSQAETLREANFMFNQFSSGNRNRSLADNLSKTLNWCGKPISNYILPYSAGSEHQIYRMPGARWRKTWHEGPSHIEFSDDAIIFEVDNISAWKKKITTYVNYHNLNPENIYVIKWKSDETRAKAFSDYQLQEWYPIKVSQCKVPKDAVSLSASGKAIKPKGTSHVGNIFLLKEASTNSSCRSKNWEKAEKVSKDKKKYYVVIDKFRIKIGKYFLEPSNLKGLNNFAKILGLDIEIREIYAVKKAYSLKLDDSWISFIEKIVELINSSNILQEYSDYLEYNASINNNIKESIKLIEDFPEDTIAREMLETFKKMKVSYDKINGSKNYIRDLMRVFKLDKMPKPSVSLDEMIKKVGETYPLLGTSRVWPGDGNHYYGYNRTKILPHVVDYIKLVEASNKEKKV